MFGSQQSVVSSQQSGWTENWALLNQAMNNDMEQVYPVIEDNRLNNRFISAQNSDPKSATPNSLIIWALLNGHDFLD